MNKSKDDKSISTFSLLRKLFRTISRKQKIYLIFVISLMLISALVQSLSVLVFAPFINLLVNPSSDIFGKVSLNIPFLEFLGNNLSLLSLGFIVVFLITISSLIQIINLKVYTTFNKNLISNICIRLFKSLTSLQYEDHIQINSSKYLNIVTLQIESSAACLMLILQFVTSALLCVGLTISIFLVNAKVGIFTFLTFGIIYYFLGVKNKKFLNRTSQKISKLNRSQIKCVQEAYLSKRDLIIYNLNRIYLQVFSRREINVRELRTNYVFLSNIPKFAIEGLSLIFLVLVSLVLVSYQDESSLNSISILGTIALASQKLIYNFQKLYSFWVGFRYRSDAFNEVLSNVEEFKKTKKSQTFLNKFQKTSYEKINFKRSLKLENVFYQYKNGKFALKNINLEIKKGEVVGIVGETGCGKTTLQDILLGILKPSSGRILVDDEPLLYEDDEYMKNWYSLICHVPQNIHVSDDSIKNNIALGKFQDKKLLSLKNASDLACINDFIESLPKGYETRIGENGILISGGQKQRIGIARALYNEPSILFLDEATSALDNKTEAKVMKNINNLKIKPTIIIIAHRLETLSYCDKVLEIIDGEINQINLDEYINIRK